MIMCKLWIDWQSSGINTLPVLKGNIDIIVQQCKVTSWPTFPTLSAALPLFTCPPLWRLHGEPCATAQAGTPPGWRRARPQRPYSDCAAAWATRYGSHPLKAQRTLMIHDLEVLPQSADVSIYRIPPCSWTSGHTPDRFHEPWTPDGPLWPAHLAKMQTMWLKWLAKNLWLKIRIFLNKHAGLQRQYKTSFYLGFSSEAVNSPSGISSWSSSIPLFTTLGLVCPSWVVPHSSGTEEGWNCTITYRDNGRHLTSTAAFIIAAPSPHLMIDFTFGLCMTIVSPDGNSSRRCHWLVETAFLYSAWSNKTPE